jgi:tRNA(Glu) U13 pseudouridine synthase TruD
VFKSFNLTEKEMKKCSEWKLWGIRRPLKMDIQELKRRNENNESIIINITLGSGCYASTFLEQLDRTILGPHGNVSRPTSRPQRNTPHKI